MPVAIDIPQQQVNPAQALWAMFQSQPKSVQVDFLRILNDADTSARHHSIKYSDAELDVVLGGCPMLHEEDITDLSDEDYKQMVKGIAHKPNKHIEKWL